MKNRTAAPGVYRLLANPKEPTGNQTCYRSPLKILLIMTRAKGIILGVDDFVEWLGRDHRF